jgi:DNA (cytosine-5)-methyltransferase 1
MGYHRAGFDVVGVDIVPQPRYPFEFVQADAIEYVLEHGHEFDAIHASPPCQAYSITKHSHDKDHPELVEPTRAALVASGLPYVIENVEGAPLLDPLTLCGTMFGLRAADVDGEPLQLRRHRLFESNVWMMAPAPCDHDPSVRVAGVYGGGASERKGDRGGYTPSAVVRRALMGMDWSTLHGTAQAIPPAYTEYIGGHLMSAVRERMSA